MPEWKHAQIVCCLKLTGLGMYVHVVPLHVAPSLTILPSCHYCSSSTSTSFGWLLIIYFLEIQNLCVEKWKNWSELLSDCEQREIAFDALFCKAAVIHIIHCEFLHKTLWRTIFKIANQTTANCWLRFFSVFLCCSSLRWPVASVVKTLSLYDKTLMDASSTKTPLEDNLVNNEEVKCEYRMLFIVALCSPTYTSSTVIVLKWTGMLT